MEAAYDPDEINRDLLNFWPTSRTAAVIFNLDTLAGLPNRRTQSNDGKASCIASTPKILPRSSRPAPPCSPRAGPGLALAGRICRAPRQNSSLLPAYLLAVGSATHPLQALLIAVREQVQKTISESVENQPTHPCLSWKSFWTLSVTTKTPSSNPQTGHSLCF